VLCLLPPAALLGARRKVLTAVICASALLAYVPLNFRVLFWGEPPTDRMPLTVVLVLFIPPLVCALYLYLWRGARAS
jgi:hypothetical protein